jgi:hypothetical protein
LPLKSGRKRVPGMPRPVDKSETPLFAEECAP